MNKNKIKILIKKIKRNLLFSSAWAIALLTVIFVNISTKESITFVGVSDSSEKVINSKFAVVVRSINVIPGEVVNKGRLLVELERTDLTQNILEVKSELNEVLHQIDLNIEIIERVKNSRDEKHFLITRKETLEQKIELYEREQNDLFIYSEFEGHVGSVNYKSGENVPPFSSILTLHSKKPRFVKGYLHEGISKKNLENTEVHVSAITSKEEVSATITHVGTKIVELPPRLRRISTEPIYGREVTVRLPLENNLLMGEKVFLEVKDGSIPTTRKIARSLKELRGSDINQIKFDFTALNEKQFEPSGMVFIKELNQFIVVSDDTRKHKPKLFLMNREGVVSNKKVLISGINKVRDLESISKIDDNNILILSSLSKDTKGEIGKTRARLLWVKREGTNFRLYKKVNLRKILLKNLNNDFSDIDIEGMSVVNQELILGVKKIKSQNKLNLISIENFKNLFSENLNDVKVKAYTKLDDVLNPIMGNDLGISGLDIQGNLAYLAIASTKTRYGGMSITVDIKDRKIIDKKIYEVARPEGVCLTTDKKLFTVFEIPRGKNGYFSQI